MAILTLQEALDALRIDAGSNDTIVQALVDSLPDYLQATTGSAWDDNTAAGYQLAQTCSRFVIKLWYNDDTANADKFQTIIDGMLRFLNSSNLTFLHFYSGCELHSFARQPELPKRLIARGNIVRATGKSLLYLPLAANQAAGNQRLLRVGFGYPNNIRH